MNLQQEKKAKLPKPLLIARIFGIILILAGIGLCITGAVIQSSSFESHSTGMKLIFSGAGMVMFGGMLILISFASKINRAGLKVSKYMIEDNKTEIKDLSKTKISLTKDIVSENREEFEQIASDAGSILKEGLKSYKQENNLSKKQMHCKHCGKKIDSDSIFCSYCGKEQ